MVSIKCGVRKGNKVHRSLHDLYDFNAATGDAAVMSTDVAYSGSYSSAFEWGLTIGGDIGYELIDEGSQDVNVSMATQLRVIETSRFGVCLRAFIQ